MNKQTLEALKGSIRKWEEIVEGTGVDKGPRNCPLCFLFFENACEGCPVSSKTKMGGCFGTPYPAWDREFNFAVGNSGWAKTPKQKALAQAELDFLKSLLPEGEGA